MTKTTLTRLASGICLATIFLASAAAAAQVKTPQSQAELKREPALDLLRLIANGRSADLDTLAITGTVVKAGALDRVLYHLPQHARGLRLAGEWSAREFPIHLTRDQLRGTVTFRLTYQNAVSVMPEASNLAVFINDREVSSRPINSPDRARTLEFDLPSLALRPGENSIRIEARQRHRVDCSIDATHELWTEIVPAATGFIFEDGTGSIDTITELGALPLTKSGKVLVNVVVANMNDTATIERGMMLAQETALAAGFSAPVVSVSSRFGEGPGLDLFAGTLDELRLLDASHAKAVGEDSALTIIAQDGVDRVALIALDGAEIGPAKVVRHDHMAGRILAGEEVAFADLGLKSRSFDGRVLHDGFDLRLPQDAFAADYDNVELNLAFAYAEGLERGAQIIVRVNGATVLGLPLTKPAGAVERNRSLRMPLSAFNPGDNHIEFEASVPASADAKCDPRQQIEGPQRFVLSDRSTIRFPNLARLAHLPNLRSTMASGFPYVGTGVATSLHLPAMNEATLSSAAALTTRMALAAGQPLALSIKRGMPDETTGNAIVIATLDDIQPQVSQRLPGVSDKALRTAWRVPSVFDGDTAIAFNAHAGGIDHTLTGSVTTDTPVEAPASDPLAAFARTEGNTSAPQNTSIVRRLLSMGSPVPVATSNFDPVTSSAVISQALAPNDGTAVWTVVTGATDDDLQSGVEALIDPASIVALDGATASFSGADGTLTSSIAKGQYVPVEWTTFANTRRVLQGWFAQNQHVYTIIMVLLLGGLGAVTNLCVRRSGPSSSRNEDRAV